MDYEIDKWDMEDMDFDDTPFNKKNKEDLRMTREYCDEHEQYYGSQTCEPIWDDKTGELKIYEIIVHTTKTEKRKFVELRDGKKRKKKTKKIKSTQT